MLKPPYAAQMSSLPSNPIFDLLPKLQKPGFISFAAGVPSPMSFPYDDVKQFCGEALTNDAELLLQYGETEGYFKLRESAVTLFERAGIKASYAEMFITTGGQQTLNLLCRLFIEPGDTVLVETPTYSAMLQIMSTYCANPVGIRADGEGILPDDLDEKLKTHDVKFVYLIPTFKNPSGQTLGLERRKEVAEIAARHGVILIEDDPYRELRYEGESLPPIKTFDETGNVIYMTSTSKILCPGLRVGVCQLPGDIYKHMIVAKQASDMHSVILAQAIVDKYLRSGLLDGHLRHIRGMYGERLTAMKSALGRYFPEEARLTSPEGGLFIWGELPEYIDTEKLLNEAIEMDVAFIPGVQFFAGGAVKNTFRLNFSNPSLEQIESGIKILGDLFKKAVVNK